MASALSEHRDVLVDTIRRVRRRWRWKVVARSLTVLAGAGVGTILIAAYGLEQFRFSPAAIITARIVTYLVLAGLGWLFFVRPLARRVSDQQVALYLEEHEPSLQELLVSAVDAGGTAHRSAQRGESEAMLERLVSSAIEKCEEVDLGRGLERRSLRRSAAVLAAIVAAAAAIFTIGPAYLRQGALAVLVPVSGVEAASPYRIDVQPGDASVARGADVTVTARLSGFTATDVDIFTRSGEGAPFERAAMIATGEDGAFETVFFGLRQSLDYFVQAAGVRSSVFRLEAAELPFVDRLDLEYVFPAYTGLEPRQVEDGGDIAVLRGTTVRLRVTSTLATTAGRVVRDRGEAVSLTAGDGGTLTGGFEVREDGTYRIDLATPAGTFVSASPQYAIDVLDDEAPVVSFAKPGRDLRSTSIDEVFAEAQADDDFGVARLELVYSVNGGLEKTLRLASGGATPAKQLSAGHTFFLEEFGLQPGDVVSYFARASDNDAVSGAKTSTSDIYFIQIQPFRKDYRAAESQAGGQQQDRGSGGAGNDASALSEQQRRIVAGTFNVVRDRDRMGAEKFRQDVVFLALTQGQLKERAKGLAAQIVARVGQADPTMKVIAGHLDAAASSMEAAEQKLQARDPKNALPAEQQALASLQRAEEAYRDVRVRMDRQQGGGGGGGGGRSAAADELADLFQLEADKLRNQYETFRQSQQQSADNKVDEMLERLKELARRQEQEAERQRQLAGNRQQGGGGGGGASGARQRQLADETEEAARQLERLSREEQRADLGATAQGLRQAAEAMRQAAASGDASAFARAREAAERLSQARDRLDQQRTDRMARDIENALSQVRRLARTQQEVAQDVRELPAAGAGRQEQLKPLLERKELQAGEVDGLERQLDRTASDFRKERQQASRRVQEAADAIRDSRLRDKIRYSRGLVQGAPPEQAATFEEQIGADIDAVEAKLREAAAAVAAPERDARAEALARARGLVRGAESMSQRLDQQREQAGARDSALRDPQGRPEQGRGAGLGTRGESGQQGQPGGGGREGDRAGGGQRTGEAGQSGWRPGLQPRQGEQSGETTGGRFEGGGQFDPRQFQREARERRTEAEALRRELQALGVDPRELDALITTMRALDSARVYTDLDEAARLQTQVAEGFRRFEFDLRRKLGAAGADQLLLGGSDDTPAAYKKLVEDYYRALAKERRKPQNPRE
jgi:hypothetical protein